MIALFFKVWWILRAIGTPLLLVGLILALAHAHGVYYIKTTDNSITIGIAEEYSEEAVLKQIEDSKRETTDAFMQKLEDVYGDK